MKTKKLNKRLVLNKTTVSHLNKNQMTGVQAGGEPTTTGAPICQFSCEASCRVTCDCTDTCTCSACGTQCGGFAC